MPASAPARRRSAPQLEQLHGAGCTKIYREKLTGARADRRQLLDMLKHLVPGRLGDGNPN